MVVGPKWMDGNLNFIAPLLQIPLFLVNHYVLYLLLNDLIFNGLYILSLQGSDRVIWETHNVVLSKVFKSYIFKWQTFYV